jgi:hypothetical protein
MDGLPINNYGTKQPDKSWEFHAVEAFCFIKDGANRSVSKIWYPWQRLHSLV